MKILIIPLLLASLAAAPAGAAPLSKPLPQSKPMPLATDVGPLPLTEGECTNLGGSVRSTMAKECASGKVCRRADAEGVVHSVCINAAS
jgi:hypothetical protein